MAILQLLHTISSSSQRIITCCMSDNLGKQLSNLHMFQQPILRAASRSIRQT